MFSELYLEKRMDRLRNFLKENKRDTLLDCFLLFFASGVDDAVKRDDEQLIHEIRSDLEMLKDYVWYKISVE